LDVTNVAAKKALIARVVTAAYMDLLDWAPGKPYPETCTLDAARFTRLGEVMEAVTLLGTIVLIAINNAGPIPQGLPGFREKLKSKIKILLDNESTEPKELKDRLRGVAEVVVKDIEEAIQAHSPIVVEGGDKPRVSPETKSAIIAQIVDVADSNNTIRKLVGQRLRSFLETVINSSSAEPTKFPPGLTAVHEELKEMAGTFLQLTVHNRRVFMSYYVDIIDYQFGIVPEPPKDEPAPTAGERQDAA
jgi:hypothetical protein